MKRVLISQRVEQMSGTGERRDALSQEWGHLCQECGILPILVPNNRFIVERILERDVDGIILTGGNDLSKYGGDAPERDAVEHLLIDYACLHKIPLLGICRGMQMILDYFGTPLIKVTGHVAVEHTLNKNDTVNSFHNFGAFTCKAPLEVVAVSSDGVLESIKHAELSNIHGIMWHPERYRPFREKDIAFIKEILDI